MRGCVVHLQTAVLPTNFRLCYTHSTAATTDQYHIDIHTCIHTCIQTTRTRPLRAHFLPTSLRHTAHSLLLLLLLLTMPSPPFFERSASHNSRHLQQLEHEPAAAGAPPVHSADMPSPFSQSALFSPILSWAPPPTPPLFPSYPLTASSPPPCHDLPSPSPVQLAFVGYSPLWPAAHESPPDNGHPVLNPLHVNHSPPTSSSSSSSLTDESHSTQQQQQSPSMPSLSLPPPPSSDSAAASSTTPADILVRRHKQRKADTQRRKREAAALADLKQLMAAAEAHISGGRRRERSEDSDEKQQRAQILESTADGMRQLLKLVDAFKQTAQCKQQQSALVPAGGAAAAETKREATSLKARQQPPTEDRSDCESMRPFDSYAVPSTSTKRLRLLVSAASRTLDASLGHSTLSSASTLPATMSAVMIDCDNGVALDVNEGMLRYGWTRSELVGSQFCAGYAYVLGIEHNYSGPLEVAQYERSKRLKRELYLGKITKCVARWRIELQDGLIEVETTTWIDSWKDVQDSEGVVTRRPLRAMAVTSLADIMPVD